MYILKDQVYDLILSILIIYEETMTCLKFDNRDYYLPYTVYISPAETLNENEDMCIIVVTLLDKEIDNYRTMLYDLETYKKNMQTYFQFANEADVIGIYNPLIAVYWKIFDINSRALIIEFTHSVRSTNMIYSKKVGLNAESQTLRYARGDTNTLSSN